MAKIHPAGTVHGTSMHTLSNWQARSNSSVAKVDELRFHMALMSLCHKDCTSSCAFFFNCAQ